MSTGRHTKGRRTRWVWVALLVAGVLLGLLGGAAYAGYRYDRARLAHILPIDLHRDPQDAFLAIESGKVVTRHSKDGRSLRTVAARAALNSAVRGQATEVTLTTRTLRPSVREADLGMTIIVRVSENRL